MTLVANGFQYKNAQIVADKLAGRSAWRLSTPQFSPLDIDTILVAGKTGRLVVVDELGESQHRQRNRGTGRGRGFDLLDAPSAGSPFPTSPARRPYGALYGTQSPTPSRRRFATSAARSTGLWLPIT